MYILYNYTQCLLPGRMNKLSISLTIVRVKIQDYYITFSSQASCILALILAIYIYICVYIASHISSISDVQRLDMTEQDVPHYHR